MKTEAKKYLYEENKYHNVSETESNYSKTSFSQSYRSIHEQYEKKYSNYNSSKNKQVQFSNKKKKHKTGLNRELTPKEKNSLIKYIVKFATMCLLFLIVSSATAAITYENDKMKNMNLELEGEVNYLKIQLEAQTSNKSIEEYAIDKLGMIYPDENYQKSIGTEEDERTSGKNYAL